MHAGVFRQITYWFCTPALAVLVGLLFGRRLVRQFPFFLIYVVVACLRDLVGLWAYYRSPANYFSIYWISYLVSAFCIFLATFELFIKRLFPSFYKVLFYRYLFAVAGFAAIALGIYAALGGGNLAIVPNIISTLNFLRVVVLIFLVALMLFMGRHWNRYEFGIALGLGVDAAAFVVTYAIFLKSGPLHGIVRELPVLAGDTACLICLITFLRGEKPNYAPTQPITPEVLEEAKKWQETLKGSLTGKKPPT